MKDTVALSTFVMRLYGLRTPPQLDLRSESSGETTVHASLGINEIWGVEFSDGAGARIAVSEGIVVTVVDVGYAVVVTPYGLMQYTFP